MSNELDYTRLKYTLSQVKELLDNNIQKFEISTIAVEVLFDLSQDGSDSLNMDTFKKITVNLEVQSNIVCFQYGVGIKVLCQLKKECDFIKSPSNIDDMINGKWNDNKEKIVWMQLCKLYVEPVVRIDSVSLFPRCMPHYKSVLLRKKSDKWYLCSTLPNCSDEVLIEKIYKLPADDYSYLESITMLESNKKHNPFHLIHPWYHCHLADTISNQNGKLVVSKAWSKECVDEMFELKADNCIKWEFSDLMKEISNPVFKKVLIFDILDYYNKIYIHIIGHLSHGSYYAYKYKSIGTPDENSLLYQHIERAIKACQGLVTVGVPLGSELIDDIAEFILIRIEHLLHLNLKSYAYSMSRISDKFLFLCKTNNVKRIEDEFNKLLAKFKLTQNVLKRKEYDSISELPYYKVLNATTLAQKLDIFDTFNGKESMEREAVLELTEKWFSLSDKTHLKEKKEFLTRILAHQIARPLFLSYQEIPNCYSKELKFALELELDYSVPSIQLCWLLYYAEKFKWELEEENDIEKLNNNFMVAIFWMRYKNQTKMKFDGVLVWDKSVYESILKVYGLDMEFKLMRNDSLVGEGFDF
eukprot:NODE_817_length_3942_cov_0.627374.p1 type:complete len:584 gc:universal NODE_817_length_3942_cov_0.627374:2504-753(-)